MYQWDRAGNTISIAGIANILFDVNHGFADSVSM
jgi:hypothetical protein